MKDSEITSHSYDVTGPDKDGELGVEWDVDTNIIWLSKSDVERMLARFEEHKVTIPGAPPKDAPAKSEPVVEYRSWTSDNGKRKQFQKFVDGICVEAITENGVVVEVRHGHHISEFSYDMFAKATAAEYAAAKSHAAKGIEPVDLSSKLSVQLCEHNERVLKLLGDLNDRVADLEQWRKSGMNAKGAV